MTIDFRASQIQVRQLIASGALDGSNKDQLLIYPKSAATNNEGGVGFDTSPLSGSDVFVYVSGSSDSKGGSESSVWVFGGDTHTSGVNHSDRISSFMSTVEGEADGIPGGINYSTVINSYGSRLSGSSISTIIAGYETDNIDAIASFVASSLNSGLLGTQFSSVISSGITSITGSQLSHIVASRQSSIDTPDTASFNSIISSLQCGITGITGSYPLGTVIIGSRQSSTNASNHFSSILSSDNSEMASSTNSSILASSECTISASGGNTCKNNVVLGSHYSHVLETVLGESERSGIMSSVSSSIASSELSFCVASDFSIVIGAINSIVGSSFQSSVGTTGFSTIMSTIGSTISWGSRNIVTATSGSTIYNSTDSSIAGGLSHRISASNNSSIVGGNTNTMVSSSNGLVLGGTENNNNSSTGSIIFGGFSNTINGGNWSFIMGQSLGVTTSTTIKMGGSTYSTNIYGPTTFTNKGSGIYGGLHAHTPAAFYHNILAESGSYGSGVAGEFIGSHQKLKLDGTPAFLAGPNITIVTNSLGQIEISGSGGGSTSGSIGIAVSPTVTGSSNIDSVSYGTNDIVFQHVGNVITYAGTIAVTPSAAGTSTFAFDMGSISTPLPDNTIAGAASVIAPSSSNITSTALVGINPALTGAEMSIAFDAVDTSVHRIGFIIVGYTSSSVGGTGGGGGGGGGPGGPQRLNIAPATTTVSTTPSVVGQVYWDSNEFGAAPTNVQLRFIMSTSGINHTGSVRLYNVSTSNYVDIHDGDTHLFVTASVPTFVTSSNLVGAANFSNNHIYELQISSSLSSSAIVLGSAEFFIS